MKATVSGLSGKISMVVVNTQPMGGDWRQELKDYHGFINWNDDEEYNASIDAMTQEEAKQRLKEDLEFVIGTNGYGELYETERRYMKLLGMEEYEDEK